MVDGGQDNGDPEKHVLDSELPVVRGVAAPRPAVAQVYVRLRMGVGLMTAPNASGWIVGRESWAPVYQREKCRTAIPRRRDATECRQCGERPARAAVASTSPPRETS